MDTQTNHRMANRRKNSTTFKQTNPNPSPPPPPSESNAAPLMIRPGVVKTVLNPRIPGTQAVPSASSQITADEGSRAGGTSWCRQSAIFTSVFPSVRYFSLSSNIYCTRRLQSITSCLSARLHVLYPKLLNRHRRNLLLLVQSDCCRQNSQLTQYINPNSNYIDLLKTVQLIINYLTAWNKVLLERQILRSASHEIPRFLWNPKVLQKPAIKTDKLREHRPLWDIHLLPVTFICSEYFTKYGEFYFTAVCYP
jgi:hypothetical protein